MSLPLQALLISIMTLSILISLSSNQWFLIWTSLEFSTFSSFFMLGKNPRPSNQYNYNIANQLKSKRSILAQNNKELQTLPLLFIIHAIASSLIIYSTTLSLIQMESWVSALMLQLALFMKMGGPPTSYWYNKVVLNLSRANIGIFLTLQKFNPIIILCWSIKPTESLILLSMLTVLVGLLSSMTQNQFHGIVACSSLIHLMWFMILMRAGFPMGQFCLMTYLLFITASLAFMPQFPVNSRLNPKPSLKNIFLESHTIGTSLHFYSMFTIFIQDTGLF